MCGELDDTLGRNDPFSSSKARWIRGAALMERGLGLTLDMYIGSKPVYRTANARRSTVEDMR